MNDLELNDWNDVLTFVSKLICIMRIRVEQYTLRQK